MAEPPSPPLPPKESVSKGSKVVWRVLLISNLAIGAYIFARARKKDSALVNSTSAEKAENSKAAVKVPSVPSTTSTTSIFEEELLPPPVTMPMKVRDPIPEEQQRELFKWMLEEKRKIKTKDPVEKKKIDEEKAILKQFLRAESVPTF
ncbi:Beta-mannosyltransferase [Quillaja saponaria]|uniref:Beta-mannosyltransferase n=1 Tax=Quillaja saponaria TaxID=32244 RepID=A0AAD7LDM8_QUISA|nr:Beta-mannosyltransferase [Quillaja saponaria]